MGLKRVLGMGILVALIALLAPSCSGSGDSPTVDSPVQVDADDQVQVSSADDEVTTEQPDEGNTPENQADGAEDQPAEPETWDMVWFSDSFGFGVAEAWADLIERDRAVEVRVHDHAGGSQSIDQVRERVRDDPEIRQELADAEIVVVFGNGRGTLSGDVRDCLMGPSRGGDPPGAPVAAEFESYGDVYRDIYAMILELRAAQPTAIRTFDRFVGRFADWREAGIETECTLLLEASADTIREAADDYAVLTASFYDAFNGQDHDQDPREQGLISGDGWHQSYAGTLAQAEVLHALGYEPLVP